MNVITSTLARVAMSQRETISRSFHSSLVMRGMVCSALTHMETFMMPVLSLSGRHGKSVESGPACSTRRMTRLTQPERQHRGGKNRHTDIAINILKGHIQ